MKCMTPAMGWGEGERMGQKQSHTTYRSIHTSWKQCSCAFHPVMSTHILTHALTHTHSRTLAQGTHKRTPPLSDPSLSTPHLCIPCLPCDRNSHPFPPTVSVY